MESKTFVHQRAKFSSFLCKKFNYLIKTNVVNQSVNQMIHRRFVHRCYAQVLVLTSQSGAHHFLLYLQVCAVSVQFLAVN